MSATSSIAMLERLIGFDTTSRNSNLVLIEFIRDYLASFAIACELVYDDDRRKANLYATLGPDDRPGICLSGHTDVVPVDGQDWRSDPFRLVRRDDFLYGRGTADMKSFIAVCLALLPDMVARNLHTPLHLAFSYDEEIGCLGVRKLLAMLAGRPLKPKACIIGEPTEMKVVRAHKGKLSVRCRVRGLASHSGLTHRGVNAVEAAAETVAYLKAMARRCRDRGPFDEELEPPYTTVHTGVLQGGTQLNIVPQDCHFDFEFRHLPQDDPEALFAEVRRFTEKHLLPEMHAVDARTGFDWQPLTRIPGLDTPERAEVVQLAKSLTGDNRSAKVSFGTEGGLFHASGIPTVICGPGSIAQAHKADEFVAVEQLERCESFLRGLLDKLADR